MKFKQKLNKLKFILPATLMLTGLSLTSVINEKVEKANAEQEKVEFKQDNKKYVSYNDTNQTISFNAEELNNYTWSNLATYFNNEFNNGESDLRSLLGESSIIYNHTDLFLNEDLSIDEGIYYYIEFTSSTMENYFLEFYCSNGKFYLYPTSGSFVDSNFNYGIAWNMSSIDSNQWEAVKNAIDLDIQANLNAVGDSITEAIASGLGLTPDLASEFLGGFTALFWDATANSGNGGLTTFSYVALVFLGIAITMAVIKLVLAIIRGSTGA